MDRLLSLLNGTLAAEPHVRSGAEHELDQAGRQPGFAPALAHVALQSSDAVPDSIKQLSLVVLKKYVKEHWDPSSSHFQAPECSEADKQETRNLLPSCLGSSSSKIRTAASMAIAGIAKHDFPQRWPGMLEWMLQTLWEQKDINLVMGVLKCLSMLAEDIDEEQLPKLVPVLLPSLLRIMNNSSYQPAMHRHVLNIVHSVLSQLGIMQGAFQRQVRDLMTPLLEPWVPVLVAVLNAPLTKESSSWAIKMECLQVMVGLVTYFGKPLNAQMPALLGACWSLFHGAGKAMYEELLVYGDGDEAGAGDGEDEGVGLEAMLSQMFEVLLALVGNPRFSKLLKPALSELAYVTIIYLQMTEEQAREWADNPNTYVADEEDAMYTARVSGELLLDELCKTQGLPAVITVLGAVERAMTTAEQMRQGQAAGVSASEHVTSRWWKLREAAILASGSISESLQEALEGYGAFMSGGSGSRRSQQALAAEGAQVKSKVQAMLGSMLLHDLQGGNSNPFLAGRALWAAAKLATLMTPTQVDQYLTAACQGIRSSLPPPVRIGACRALVQLLPVADSGVQGARRAAAVGWTNARLAPALPALYEGLVALLNDSSEETLHLVLETLAVVVKNDTTCVVQQYLSQVSGPVLRVWEGSVADPLIGEDATSVLEALAAHPQCLGPLVNQLVPALVRVISTPSQQRPMMVEASLQLLRSLVRRPQPAQTATATGPGGTAALVNGSSTETALAQHASVVQQVYMAAIMPLLSLLDTSDDSSVQQEAQQLLCQLIRYGRAALLSWAGSPPATTVERLMGTLMKLLSAEQREMETALAGHLAADMLNAFPWDLMQPYVPKLLEAACRRLVRVNFAPLVSGLLLFLSLCVRASCHETLEALTRFNVTLPDGQQVRALEAVVPIWIDRASDVHGRYHMALVTTALGALLESGSQHLQQMQVKGKRLDLSNGVRTRSQVAAAGGEQYSQVPVPVKLVAALAQVLADKQEAAKGDTTEDAEWEEDDEEYESGDEEEVTEEGGEASPGSRGGLSVQGAQYNRAQDKLLETVSRGGSLHGAVSTLATGSAAAWEGDGGPLSPSSALRDDDMTPGADDAAPPGDPLATLDLGAWVSELFQRLALQEAGRSLLQAASELAMTRRQTEAVQKLLQASRLRAD